MLADLVFNDHLKLLSFYRKALCSILSFIKELAYFIMGTCKVTYNSIVLKVLSIEYVIKQPVAHQDTAFGNKDYLKYLFELLL